MAQARLVTIIAPLICGALFYPYFRASLQLYDIRHAYCLAALGAAIGAGAMYTLLWNGWTRVSPTVRWCFAAAIAMGILFRDTSIPGGIGSSLSIGIAQGVAITIFLVALGYKVILYARAARISAVTKTSTVWLAVALWAGLIIVFLLWISLSRYIWYWDYAEYAHLSANLYSVEGSSGYAEAFSLVRSTLTSEYNLVPAFPISIVETVFGSSDRVVLLFAIALLYVGPVMLMLSYIVHKASGYRLSGAMAMLITFLTAAAFPMTFYAALYGMPDIGGVLLILAVAISLYRTQNEEKSETDRMATLIFCAGSIFLLFVFRRWYLFIVPFLIFALAAREWNFWRRHPEHKQWFWKAALVFASYLVLCVLVFYWQRVAIMAKGGYADAYRAYWPGFGNVLSTALKFVGYLPWATALASLVLLASRRQTRTTAICIVLCLSTTMFLFMQIQGPAPHHYLLVLPVIIFLVSHAVSTVYIGRPRSGKVLIGGLTLLAVTSLVGVSHPYSHGKLIGDGVFPRMDMRPPKRHDLPEVYRLTHDLGQEASQGHAFCIVETDQNLNSSIFMEAAIASGESERSPVLGKQLWLGDVDRRDGPSMPFQSCDIAVVGTPTQTPLGAHEQQTILYLANSLRSGKGIGSSFQDMGQSYDLDWGVHVRLYRRIAPINPEDWQKYVTAVTVK